MALFANLIVWIGIVIYFGLYLLIVQLASIVQAIRFKQWEFIFLLPIMFVEGHIFWSLGILKEIFLPVERE